MPRTHRYSTEVVWTGNRGAGTRGYRGYDRSYSTTGPGRPAIPGSADPGVAPGDPGRWNPELLLLASLSQCHMLWYLHLCSVHEVVVTGYVDQAEATMQEADGGAGGRFTEAVLRPRVRVAAPDMVDRAVALHADAHRACFVASSVNFPVRHEPVVEVDEEAPADPAR